MEIHLYKNGITLSKKKLFFGIFIIFNSCFILIMINMMRTYMVLNSKNLFRHPNV